MAGRFRFGFEIRGLDELRRKLSERPIHHDPVAQVLLRLALNVESGARRLAPVDTGRLRASISHRLDPSATPRWAVVGTNVQYARFVHEGRRPGRMPPVRALETWARRHGGLSPFVVARAIARRGIRPRRFLTDALEQVREQIAPALRRAAMEIERRWAGRG